MTVVTLCDAASLAINGAAEPDMVERMQEILSVITFVVYSTDMLFKMAAYGLSGKNGYFRRGWSLFEFALIAIGLADIVLHAVQNGDGAFKASILRLVRAARVLRIIRITARVRIAKALMETIAYGTMQSWRYIKLHAWPYFFCHCDGKFNSLIKKLMH